MQRARSSPAATDAHAELAQVVTRLGLKVPEPGPAVTRRGNFVSRGIGAACMTLTRWRFEGALPNEPKFVIIVAPHTSNWDFAVGVQALFSLGVRVSFLGKHTLFKGPLGPPMRWLGGIPVERTVRRDRVAESVAAFREKEKLILALAPEGTRKRVSEWKTGFYHVAAGAGVPIVPVAFDYGARVIRIGQPVHPSRDRDRDIAALKRFYRGVRGKRPNQFRL